jgi:glucosamine--fructose-6-phosphate aminotransferase (isomerizing)
MMCGIIACRVAADATPYLVTALERLEYRGYDSAGIAVCAADNSTAVFRTTSRVSALPALAAAWEGPQLGGTGIGHTRWATHGGVCVSNAHPHQDCDRRLSVVHNGIITNAELLSAELVRAGHILSSDVDSEIICHLVEDAIKATGDLLAAVIRAVKSLSGSWAFVVLDAETGRMVAAAHHSPLLVAQSNDGLFLASDIGAIRDWVDRFRILENGDIVEVTDTLVWTHDGAPAPTPAAIECPPQATGGRELGRNDHMINEIDEQPEVTARVLDKIGGEIANGALWRGLGIAPFDRLRLLACGTSLNAGEVIGMALSHIGSLPFSTMVASEAAGSVVEPGTLTLAISQSGETADVLRAVDEGPADAPIVALVNNIHSSLARKAGVVLGCSAGEEVGVAATKTFICQVLVGTGLVISAMVDFGRISRSRARDLVDDLYGLPDRLALATATAHSAIPSVVDEVRNASGFIFLGRGSGVPYAREGALKLKELTYRWAEAYPAGELKHGPLALVEDGTPVVVVDNGDSRLLGNLAEARARGGRIFSVGRSGGRIQVPLSALAPCGPIEAVIPLQLLALSLAQSLGLDADKPRNLAKSVTVD